MSVVCKKWLGKFLQLVTSAHSNPKDWGHATLALITVLYLVSVCFACCVCMAVELIILTSRRTKIQSVTYSLTQIRGASGEKKKFTNFGKHTYICVHTLVFLISEFQISTFNFTIDKGQMISKHLFGVFNFFQKMNENMLHTSRNEFICLFFGKIQGLTICFWN